MPSTSSLLRSAASARKKIQDQQDAEVAFDWAQSSKTYEDFIAYTDYINNRINESSSDPSKRLTLEKTIVSARKGYTSNEIQRQSINILEGRGTSMDKYNVMTNLFYQAVDNGDYDLAQGLNLQLDNLSVKIQNEHEAEQRTYAAMAATQTKSMKQLITKLQKGTEEITLPSGEKVAPFGLINKEIRDSANKYSEAQLFALAYDTAYAISSLAIDAYNSAQTQEDADAILNGDLGKIINGEKAFKIGGKDLDLNELNLAYQSAQMNNPIYSLKQGYNEATGKNEYKLTENKIKDFAWIRQLDEQGNETYAPIKVRTNTNEKGIGLDTRLTTNNEIARDSGEQGISSVGKDGRVKTQDTKTIGQRLGELGITTRSEGGTIYIKQGADAEREAIITPEGKIRYFDDNGQLNEISPYTYQATPDIKVEAGISRIVAPDEISDFGTPSDFGGNISSASKVGANILDSYRGISSLGAFDSTNPNNVIKMHDINTQTGRELPLTGTMAQGGASNIFNRSSVVLQKNEERKAALIAQQTATANQVQQAQAFNINQTPVRQTASNGMPVRQLTIGKPSYLPPLSIGTVAPQKVSIGQTANPGTLKMGNTTQTGTLRMR